MRHQPLKHQRDWHEANAHRKCAAKFWEMGLGKSKAVIDNACWLYENHEIDGVLILAPKGSMQVWPVEQLPQHAWEEQEHASAWWCSDAPVAQKRAAEQLAKSGSWARLDWLVMNTEGVAFEKGRAIAKDFLKSHPNTMMVVDESSDIKNPNADRTKAVIELGAMAKYRRILTGTPMLKNPLDLYSQFKFLLQDQMPFQNFISFRHFYGIEQQMKMGTRSFKKVVGFKRLDHLAKFAQPFVSSLRKKECLELPEKILMDRIIAMTPEQEKAYNSMKERSYALLSTGTEVTSLTAIGELNKLHQIAGGFIKTVDGWEALPNNKIPEVLRIVDQVDDKIIVWCRFVQEAYAVAKAVNEEFGPGSATTYAGPDSPAQRQENLAYFKQGPRCRVIAMTSAGSKGLTILEAATVVDYSQPFNLGDFLQSRDRNHRIGQTRAVTYISLICPGTVDELVVEYNRAKRAIGDSVLQALKQASGFAGRVVPAPGAALSDEELQRLEQDP